MVKVRNRRRGPDSANNQSPLEEEPAEVDQSTNNDEKPSMV
jgi:hypothetical protein